MQRSKIWVKCDVCGWEASFDESRGNPWRMTIPVLAVTDITRHAKRETETLDLCFKCQQKVIRIRRVDRQREKFIDYRVGSGYEVVGHTFQVIEDVEDWQFDSRIGNGLEVLVPELKDATEGDEE